MKDELARAAKVLMRGMRERTGRDPDIADFAATFEPILGRMFLEDLDVSQVRQERDMSFEAMGSKLDAMARDLKQNIDDRMRPLEEKYKEIRDGLIEATKTSERKGFERAVSICAAEPGVLMILKKRGEDWPAYHERYKKALAEKLKSLRYTE